MTTLTATLQVAVAECAPIRQFLIGQRVRFRSGTLEALEGTVTDKRGKDRLLVSLPTKPFGACIEIDAAAVEILDEPMACIKVS